MSNKTIPQPKLHEALEYFLYHDPANALDRIRGQRKAAEKEAERKKRGKSRHWVRAEQAFSKDHHES